MKLTFILNGKETTIETKPDRRVVDLLREDLGLTGVKECCGAGECGACTILVDGESRLSCLMLAAQLENRQILTAEGVAIEERLHVMQQAFIDCGAVQCGFCIPGMILASLDLLNRCPDPTPDQVRVGLSGNLCRCTGYQKIVEAVLMAARQLQGRES
ncbi:MAG: (2Fe-2S)-binding domain protein [Firmicutes bacterium]|nr:(2Fe-2S)-binding domain protein [Bacillota bacterium]